MANSASRSRAFIALGTALVLLSLVGHVLVDAIGDTSTPILSGAKEHRHSHSEMDDDDAILPGPSHALAKLTALSPFLNHNLRQADWSFLPPVPPPIL